MVWAALLCGLAGFTPLSGAYAASDKTQNMVYDVYAGGFHVVQADVTIDEAKKDAYSLFMGARTYGFLGRVAPWHGTFETAGWSKGAERQPEIHESVTTWRDEEEINTYNYNRDGSFKSYVIKEHGKEAEKKDVEDELTQGTIDALTAALKVFDQVGNGGTCDGSSEVFDGKRRFEQIFKQAKEVNLSPSKYNIYGGPAVECTVEIKPVAGKWHDKPRGWMSIQEQGRERGMMPTIWLARLSENGPAVPVKIQVKTAYGALLMHLAQYRNGETVSVAEKRPDQ